MHLLQPWPCLYLLGAIVWSTYQGARGVWETRINAGDWIKKIQSPQWQRFGRFFLLDLHDFVFRFVCTMAGFTTLLIAWRLAEAVDSRAVNLDAGTATLLSLTFLVGVIGVGGQLHFVVLLARVPK